MKVCFLITGLGVGGAERYLLRLVPNLKFEKFIISLTNLNQFGKQIEKKGIKIYYLGGNRLNILSTVLKFWNIIKREKPDILDTYLIHSNLFGRFFGRLFGVKKIISSIRNDYSNLKLLNFIDRISQKLIDRYILNSESLLAYVNIKNKISMHKISIIPNGIDLDLLYSNLKTDYNIREELGLKTNSFIVLCISRLFKHKNITVLLRAFKRLHEKLHLIIIGDGPEKIKITKFIKKFDLTENVFLIEKRKDIYNIIYNSDLYVLPSLREGMNNTLLEAMALKKICIVSNIPQNRLLIKDGFNGLVFDPNNIEDLADKIMYAFKHRNKLQFGLESFKIIQENYNIRDIIDKYENVIEQLLEPKY